MVRRCVLFVVCSLFLTSELCAQPEIPVDMYTGAPTINTPYWTLESQDLVKLFDSANGDFMKLNASSLLAGTTGAAIDSVDFALFLSFFRKKCPPQSFQKQDYFFGRSLCQIPDKLVRTILKPEYFNPLGYYSFGVYDRKDMKVVIYGCADGSGDGFFIFRAASFSPKGDMLTDQQIAFVPADKILKNEFKVSIVKDVIVLTCVAFEQGAIRATILPDGGILTEE